jgi:DNA gyrase subunit B
MVDSTIIEAAVQYNESFSESLLTFANCVNTRDGGSHLTGFRSALTRVLNDYARNSKFLKDTDPNLTGEDVREGAVVIISVKLPQPQFEGQTKARLGNPEVKTHVESAVASSLSLYLEQHPSEAKAIMEKCLTAAKAREAARKARDLVLKKIGFETSTLPGKLADCSDKEPAQCELYLVEGPSAGGSAKQGRDRRFQAILPLRGKILNVEKASKDKIIVHEELRAIVTALKTSTDDQFDSSKLRYHKVIIMTDADVDGAHIRTLLLTFFFRHMTELINQGYLYIAQPPLYRVKSGKQHFWLYSEQEKEETLRKLKEDKVEIQRYKGLGEMTPEQLWETTMNPANRTLLQVQVEDGIAADEAFRMLMGDEVLPRKRFIMAHAQSVKNLDV